MRTPESLRAHYEIERELASRLRHCETLERRRLYGSVYDEMLRRVPDHPMLTLKMDPEATRRTVAAQMRLIGRFLKPDTHYLEVGPGDCALAFAVARDVRQVYAVDVSEVISSSTLAPPNFKLILSDGVSIDVPSGTVSVAFSNQLMEHLHPDDAREQLKNIYDALTPGGAYVCITPSALSGPHDISGLYEDVASGFHLKEYTNAELSALFLNVGFSRIRVMLSVRGRSILIPVWPCVAIEAFVRMLPRALRRNLAGRLPLRLFLGVQLVGFKAAGTQPLPRS